MLEDMSAVAEMYGDEADVTNIRGVWFDQVRKGSALVPETEIVANQPAGATSR